jgi:hypothetical protein
VLSKVLVGRIGLLAAVFFISAEVDKRVWIVARVGPAPLAIASQIESGDEAYLASYAPASAGAARSLPS